MLSVTNLGFSFGESRIYTFKWMTWKIVRVLEGRCLFVIRLHVKGRFPVKSLANLILFTQPSTVSVTAAKWIDSWARLQFRFFLNLFSCLLTTNLSRRNNKSRVGLQTLFNFRWNGNRQWILITFHVYSRYLAATRDVHSTAIGENDSLFVLQPRCNAIRVRTPPGAGYSNAMIWLVRDTCLNAAIWLVRDTNPTTTIWLVRNTYPNAAIWLVRATYHSIR